MSSAVYQPTTVTYDNGHSSGGGGGGAGVGSDDASWSGAAGGGYLSQLTRGRRRHPCCCCGAAGGGGVFSCVPPSRTVLPLVYLTSSVASAVVGLALVVHGSLGYEQSAAASVGGGGGDAFYLTILVLGTLFLLLALASLGLYLRLTRRLCFRHSMREKLSGMVGVGKGAGGNGTGGGTQSARGGGALVDGSVPSMAVNNPSTDLLVTAQYAPVSDVVAYQQGLEDSEQTKLMSSSNGESKDNGGDDCERMIDSDPRIVLRPLNTVPLEEA